MTQTVAEIKEEGVKFEKNGFMKCENGKIFPLPLSILGSMPF